MLSQIWFGVILCETDMSVTFRRLVNLKDTSYRLVGKIRDHNDDILLIKFLVKFNKEVNFFSLFNERYADVYNTILPVTDNVERYVEIVKRTTFIEEGVDPVSEKIIDEAERYFSSDDEAFTSPTSSLSIDDEDEDESLEEISDEELKDLQKK